jgi:3-dehydroquinate synthetase
MVEAMLQDKKVVRGSLNLILARGIGKSFVARDISTKAVRDFLTGELLESRPGGVLRASPR